MAEISSTQPFRFKHPLRIYILNWLMYASPISFFVLQLYTTKYFSVAETTQMILKPEIFISMIVSMILPFIITKIFLPRIEAYDGSPESVRICDKAHALYPTISIGVPWLNAHVANVCRPTWLVRCFAMFASSAILPRW